MDQWTSGPGPRAQDQCRVQDQWTRAQGLGPMDQGSGPRDRGPGPGLVHQGPGSVPMVSDLIWVTLTQERHCMPKTVVIVMLWMAMIFSEIT